MEGFCRFLRMNICGYFSSFLDLRDRFTRVDFNGGKCGGFDKDCRFLEYFN